jgi:hypothetical protein
MQRPTNYQESVKSPQILAIIEILLKKRSTLFVNIRDQNNLGSLIIDFLFIIVICNGVYGFLLGISSGMRQGLYSAAKFPFVFLLTLCLSYVTLYVLSLYHNMRLTLIQLLCMMLSMVATTSLFLFALLPILGFIILKFGTTQGIELTHFIIFAFSSWIGVKTLYEGMYILFKNSDCTGTSDFHWRDHFRQALTNLMVFKCDWSFTPRSTRSIEKLMLTWLTVYLLVGLQVAWIFRPLIGGKDFGPVKTEFIRHADGDIFSNGYDTIRAVLPDLKMHFQRRR